MPKLYEYLGITVFFFLPGNICRSMFMAGVVVRETKAEIITANGKVVAVRLCRVANRRPLAGKVRKHFLELVNTKAEDILKKWNDVFVMNKIVHPEFITRRIR